jgi:signal transduction histidine kinase
MMGEAGRRRFERIASTRRASFASDALLVVLLILFEIVVVVTIIKRGEDFSQAQRLLFVTVTPLLPIPLSWRRSRPDYALFGVAVLTAIVWLADVDRTTIVTGSLALYWSGRSSGTRRALKAWIFTIALLIPVGLASALMSNDPSRWFGYATRCSVLLGVFWFGSAIRAQTALTHELIDRAHRAEQLAEETHKRAVLEERTRISRELHDVVAHTLTVMVVQSDVAARLVRTQPAAATTAAEQAAKTGRVALGEIRSLMATLSTGEESAESLPQPTLESIGALIDAFAGSGFVVDVSVDEQLSDDDIPPGIALCAYRVIQEALTNALKYSGSNLATVTLMADGDEIEVLVVNGPPSPDRSVLAQGSGLGLLGITERVRLARGTLRYGQTASGGFEVRCRLPLKRAQTGSLS